MQDEEKHVESDTALLTHIVKKGKIKVDSWNTRGLSGETFGCDRDGAAHPADRMRE
jgi:hypothetical protein